MSALLDLLDGALSQNEQLVRDAIRNAYSEENIGVTEQEEMMVSIVRDNDQTSLKRIVTHILDSDPNSPSVKNMQDLSLPLHFAAVLGHYDVFEMILKQYPAAVLAANQKGKLPIHYAAREGRLNIIDLLLKQDSNCAKFLSKKQKLPLHFAVCEGHLEISARLLRAFPESAFIKTQKGRLPLHFASRWGHNLLVKHLLSLYPEAVKSPDWEGSLPLHDAARQGQVEVTKYLLRVYKDAIYKVNQRGETPIFCAARSSNPDCLKELLITWSDGGKNLLMNLRPDDGIDSWEMIDLCLRSSVEEWPKFSDQIKTRNVAKKVIAHRCRFIEDSSNLRCDLAEDISTAKCCCKSFGYKRPLQSCASREDSCFKNDSDYTRSKRRSLQQFYSQINPDSFNIPVCSCAKDNRPLTEDYKNDKVARSECCATLTAESKHYFALHTALRCKASHFVIQKALKTFPNQVALCDHLQRSPLHLALIYSGQLKMISVLIQQLLGLHPQAAYERDSFGRLPLHYAILGNVKTQVIKQLLIANESSTFKVCKTRDIFHDKEPWFMAVCCDSDVEIIYLLIRGKPSVVKEHSEIFIMINNVPDVIIRS